MFNKEVLHSERGMTLVEILLVSVLIALMSGTLYGTVNGILSARLAVQEQRAAIQSVQSFYSRIAREISGRVSQPLSFETEDDDEPDDEESGINGSIPGQSASSIQGLNKRGERYPRDIIRFASGNAAQPYIGSLGNAGIIEVEYSLEKSSEIDPFFKDDDDKRNKSNEDSFVLVRTEQPAKVEDKKLREQKRSRIPIANNIVGLNFRYLRDGNWVDDWREKTSILPNAIEIEIFVKGDTGTVQRYKTAVFLSQKPRRASGNNLPFS